jgi:cell division protein FtsL
MSRSKFMSSRGMGGTARALGPNGASVGRVFLHLLPAVLLFGLFAGVGILHVTSRVLVVDMGYRLSKAEAEGRDLTRENDRLKLELATLKNPARLERLAREKLGMAMPAGPAVIALPESGGKRPVQARSAPVVRVAERGGAL